MINTKNIQQLEMAQNTVIKKWNAELSEVIKNGHVTLEDCLP